MNCISQIRKLSAETHTRIRQRKIQEILLDTHYHALPLPHLHPRAHLMGKNQVCLRDTWLSCWLSHHSERGGRCPPNIILCELLWSKKSPMCFVGVIKVTCETVSVCSSPTQPPPQVFPWKAENCLFQPLWRVSLPLEMTEVRSASSN